MDIPLDPAPAADPATATGGEVVWRPALQCLVIIARHYGIGVTADRLVHDNVLPLRDLSSGEVARLAQVMGMKARPARVGWTRLTRMGDVFPLIARHTDGRALVVTAVRKEGAETLVWVIDPAAKRPEPAPMTREAFAAGWKGEVVLIRRLYSASSGEPQSFGLRWFATEVWAERAAFRDIGVTAIMLDFLGLITPFFFQVVIDRVLGHDSYATLYVLVAGVLAAILFEVAFGYLRRILLMTATNKIDLRLATRTFDHLVSLPISYFEKVPSGVTIRHMQQVEKIRGFLTGRVLVTLLDATALLIFLPILFTYNVELTLVVLFFTGLITLTIMALLDPFKRRLEELYLAEAERQSMLIEAIHGMRTVKSSAIEPILCGKWDQTAANAVHMRFRVGQMSIAAGTVIQVIGQLLPVVLLGLGTAEVVNHTLSVGSLIAFQMLSGRVVSPLVSMVSLVQDYQEVLMSVRMLGEVMNHEPERPPGTAGLCPAIGGNLEFERVRFRYTPDGPPILDNVSLRIPSGAVVGIVGRSGSGKTTLTRLVQGMSLPQEGVIRFDGIDIREIDLPHLRRSIGVVLQENFLFRGSLRENLSITRPGATLEEVISAARMSGADEFIERMPKAYDTQIEEGATNLSGGQRQRLAIARALLLRPKLLILDEATSALDPDSEAIFMDNLNSIVSGRTVLIVSHRLTTLVRCTAIIVMDRGRIVDGGTHNELLQRCAIYQHLWNQQNRQH